MSAEAVGSTFSAIGKVIETAAPLATAANPIAGGLVLLGAEILEAVGAGLSAGAEIDAQLVADVRVALDDSRKRRAAAHGGHDALTAETQHAIDLARAKFAAAVEPVVAATTSRKDEPTVDLKPPVPVTDLK